MFLSFTEFLSIFMMFVDLRGHDVNQLFSPIQGSKCVILLSQLLKTLLQEAC
jgi:hypothetical protein